MKKEKDNIEREELQPEELKETEQTPLNGENEEQEVDGDTRSVEEVDPLTALQEEYDKLNDSHIRLHAEFDNFRRRTAKEKADLVKGGGERVLSEMLPFADDFERALDSLQNADDKDGLVEGVNLIYHKFTEFLKQHGVNEIETIGQPFDADLFEAVTTIPAQDESQKGLVIDCIQKGYTLNEKIIRYPKVIVGE